MPKIIPQKIIYGIHQTEFGKTIIAISDKGVFWLGFMISVKNGAYKGDALSRFYNYQKKYYPNAKVIKDESQTKSILLRVMKAWGSGREKEIELDLQGTKFQKQVWKALLHISKGSVKTYGDVANDIKRPKAMRAVGSAVGNNPVSLIIPCHRVLPMAGGVGNYGWGSVLKKEILKKENVLFENT